MDREIRRAKAIPRIPKNSVKHPERPPAIFQMHHPHTLSAVRHYRLAALMLLSNRLLAPAAAGLLLFSLMTANHQWTMIGSGLVFLSMVFVPAQWIAASRTGCPLCLTPVLAPKTCMKHRRARSFLGSHRLRVAFTILFRNRFRCPYCNESTGLELRETIHRTPPPRRQLH